MGVFVHKRIIRRLVIRSEALFLNEYPFDGRNMVVEYNGLLAAPPHQLAVYRETIAHLFQTYNSCDELFFSALRSTSPLIHLAGQMRVCNSSDAIGYLYNYIWRKHVYVLQAGFKLSEDKQLMSGYIAHVLAIAHNKQ